MSDIGKVQQREIVEEMRESYLDYAMSVIVARALPDVRDGLKPVHRRILYSMHDMGLTHAVKFRKSAAIVGDCLGKYHPHGDIAVYDTLVRLAQDFSLRYPLIDGQGNFGSIDGDSAAAMRYTEARMTRIGEELLRDIEKETVDFRPNYDGTREEPIVLPASIPNLILNGTIGIAVGMATNIPPHNMTEVVDALIHLINHPRATNDDLMEFVKGPDFPTGGIIFDEKEIRTTYASGKGAILNRGVAEITEDAKGRAQIVVTEIPYQVNKAELIETIANMATEKRLEGIRDIRDESDKDGLRIVIELKQDAHPQKVLNNLYQHTDLEKSFHLNMLALVDGIQPQVMSLKGVLEEFAKHRVDVVTRRTKFDLARAKERIHILEGLKKALDQIDRVIETIKKSADKDEARVNLMKKFGLSEIQAGAILEMRLQSLAGLERQKIESELKDKLALARSLEALLKDPAKVRAEIIKELGEIKQKFGDERRTKVIKSSPREFSEEDLIADEEVVVMLTRGGYIKRIKPENYRMQKRGGKGLIGIETKEEDAVERLLTCNTHSSLLFFTDSGKIYEVRAYEVPEGSRTSKGKTIFNFLSIAQGERVTSILAVPKKDKKREASSGFIVMVTQNGIIKKVESSVFENVRRSGLIAINLKKGDALDFAELTAGSDELMLVTKHGQAIHFKEKDVRPMGRQAAGVRAMRLKKNDMVVGMSVVNNRPALSRVEGLHTASNQKLLVVMDQGYGKHTPVKQYKIQRRGGSGIKTAKVTQKTGSVVGAYIIGAQDSELIAISRKGQVIRTELSSIPTLGRATQGVRIMKLNPGDAVASITTL
ncbi:MAG: DNA gyrase subunit A [Candidatus Sungbacteria bacterium]|nr:DNA gyrase subunit A [Candidatus Sungbacteria bacterium]